MGSKSSNAQAPDPALIAAQIKSMGIQDSAIQSVLANSNSMLPLQKEQLQFGLDASKTAYGQSQEDRSWMLDRRENLTGTQDQMLQDAQTFDTTAKQEELAGKAEADVNLGFSSAREQAKRAQSRMGVNPSSGRAAALDGQIQIAQAAALAGGANSARPGAVRRGKCLVDYK